jgi:hypothetical protein
MELPYNTSLNTTYIHESEADNGLTQVREYLENTTSTYEAIVKTLEQQTNTFKEIHNAIQQVIPTITLTPKCYISFEKENEGVRGEIKRKMLGINSKKNGLTEVATITINAGRNNTFKYNATTDTSAKNAAKKTAYNFNASLENLIPHIPGHYFILKGQEAPDKKSCLHALKNISKINQYVQQQSYKKNDIPTTIEYTCSSNNEIPAIISFAQMVYQQAKALRLFYCYKNELAKNNQIKKLTQNLPNDIIAKEANLALLQKITVQLKSIYETADKAVQQNSSISHTLFTNLEKSLSEWLGKFKDQNSLNDFTEEIITQCDNWLPTIKWHGRIEDKSLEDNKNNYVPDNHYANGKISTENIRYNPDHWLSQCSKPITGIIGQLYKNPHTIPVINNLYINSPLMIDSFVLKHGIKKPWNKDSSRYELKGKIYIFLPDGNGGWRQAQNNNTQQPFYIEKIFTCAINNTIHNDTYEVYHRGAENLNDNDNNSINQYYVYDKNHLNDNWFFDTNITDLAERLPAIVGQPSPSNTINNYVAEQNKTFKTYTDNFDNYVCNVDDSSLTIWMPPMKTRIWAMQIKLEKPVKHNFM